MKMNTILSAWVPTLCLAAIPASLVLADFDDPFERPPTNSAPTLRIISPHDGAMFLLGDPIHICAEARFFTDTVASVEFFAGTNSLGQVTNHPVLWEERSDFFCLTWSNAPAGTFTLRAVATEANGASVPSAAVDIAVVTNFPPRVHITKPSDGEAIRGPTNILICASAFDRDGSVVSVEFFQGGTSLGVVPTPPIVYVTNHHGVFPIKPPYCLTWSNVPLGDFTLTAVATDNAGVTSVSAPVHITVVSDLPPRVHIYHPFNGATFQSPTHIDICAVASDPDGSVSSVEFFAGGTSVGVVTNAVRLTNCWEVHTVYCLTWSNPPAGPSVLTAVATDDAGLMSTSAPVHITVLPPPAPTVKITTPHDGAIIYGAPTRIYVCAAERYFTNPVVNVSFLAGTNVLGMTTNTPYSCIVWKNVAAGTYSLTAVAMEQNGMTVTSAPVNITVKTNRPPPIWQNWDQ